MAKASRATNDCSIGKYAHQEITRVYKEIGTSPNGLSRSQVERMREKHGTNSFSHRNNDTIMWRLRRAFINPFNVILLTNQSKNRAAL